MKFLIKQKKIIIPFLLILFSVFLVVKYSTAQDSLGAKMSGRVLLQVEDRGQAWYINPENEKKYYLGTPEESFSLFKKLGFFMDAKILNKYLASTFPNNYSGRIIINAQENYESYYINPLDLKAIPLNSPLDAFNIMKKFSLGVNDNNLKLIKTYNHLDNDIFSSEILDSSFEVSVVAPEPVKMKDFTRIVELSGEVINPQNRRILEQGLVWDYVTISDVSVSPTLKNNYQRVLSENNSDVLTVKISDLVPGSYPFFRFYVITEDNETVYSNIQIIKGEKNDNLPLLPAPSSGSSSGGTTGVVKVDKYVLSYIAGEGGEVDGPSLQVVNKGGLGETVVAKALSGYKFISWSDGSSDKIRIDSPIDSNLVLIAQFAPVCNNEIIFYDNFIYHTVAIGEQCWLKENLRNTQTSSGYLRKSFCYNGSSNTVACDTYGRLYPYQSVLWSGAESDDNPSGVQSICPNNWHLPSKSEWEQLSNYILEGTENLSPSQAANRFKASSNWWPNLGTDDFGFSALPGGSKSSSLGYVGLTNQAMFWSTTKGALPETTFVFSLGTTIDIHSGNYQNDSLSVRCVQD